MSRYTLLLRTIKENPFNSTHFAWCNMCIERMGWKSSYYLPKIFESYRDKFSSCYIDYQPESLVKNINKYYEYGRCSMCSGFFTGNEYYMKMFCHKIIEKFKEMCYIGLGHADEQLFTLVYFNNPDIFDFYFGDYQEMIINYFDIIDNPHKPVYNIMKNLYESRERNHLLLEITNKWLLSYINNNFTASLDLLNQVMFYNHFAKNIK